MIIKIYTDNLRFKIFERKYFDMEYSDQYDLVK
jgi:hypothetical protein